jgi:ActR/RegA family two-component response regulator
MIAHEIMILEDDHATASKIQRSLQGIPVNAVHFDSAPDALRYDHWPALDAVIADARTLTDDRRDTPGREIQFKRWISDFRTAHERSAAGSEDRRPLVVIVTSGSQDVAEHAAAVKGGADLYLPEDAATDPEIVCTYLHRMLRPRESDADAPSIPGIFALPTERLRSGSGRLDAELVARALGVSLRKLAEAIGVGHTTVHKTPDSPALQPRLAPYASVIAMLDDVYGGDTRWALAWLQSAQPGLGSRAPLDVMLQPGGASAVEQFVSGAWLGDPD